MPKIEAIINQCQRRCPKDMPEVTSILESDPDRIAEALRERGSDADYYAFLRTLSAKVMKQLKPQTKQFLTPLLEINVGQLRGPMQVQARLQVCEGIVAAQDLYRTTALDKLIADLSKMNLSIAQLARLEVASAGNNFLKGDYAKAAWEYLAAARMEAYVHDEQMRTQLVERAIAFAFAAPIAPQTHRIVCALCLNQTAKRSPLFPFLSKLYRQDMISKQDLGEVEKRLPKVLGHKDAMGVSILEQAAFSRNMIPIINSFSTVKLQTLLRLSAVGSMDQLLVLLEKTYGAGEVSIDQIKEVVHIQPQRGTSELVKEFLGQIDTVLQSKEGEA